MPEPVRVYPPGRWEPADPTPGMAREQAFAVPGLWAGRVVTAAGAASGWHHHAANESALYVVQGVLRLECEGVEGYVDAEAGSFVHVPSHAVHRESNPSGEESVALIARAGTDVSTVNVDGPPPPHA